MDAGWASIWVDFAQFVLTGGIGIYLHMELRDRARGRQVDDLSLKLDERLDAHAVRIAKQETLLAALPDRAACAVHSERICDIEAKVAATPVHSDLVRIHERLDEQTAQVSTIAGGLQRVETLLDTMHRHLLSNAVVKSRRKP